MSVEITYNGKSYKTFDSAIEDAIVDSMRENIMNSINPFRTEINKHGGKVNVNISGNRLTVNCTNLPDELIERIQKAISE